MLGKEIGHECGVFGMFAPGEPVAHLTYLGLHTIQHRGQEAAGICVSDGNSLNMVKDAGLVTAVFNQRILESLPGHISIGHTRYSTTGASSSENAQPFYRETNGIKFALAHNGNLTNTSHLIEELGMLPGTTTSDSDIISQLLEREIREVVRDNEGDDDTSSTSILEMAMTRVAKIIQGAYSLLLITEGALIAVRDPNGVWPLVLGRLTEGWVVASETPAFDVVGAAFVRNINPGEMVTITDDGVASKATVSPLLVNPTLCLFEFVYFHRPDGVLYDRSIHHARVQMGKELAEQAPVEADMVMGVPESGVPAAQGYAEASGIPYGQGLVKNRYMGRTFIAPTQSLRSLGVRMKLNPIRASVRGKRIVVVDDSIVRGTTMRSIVSMLREAGATEIHLRISSPPYRHPCFYGMDTGSPKELVASSLEVDEIGKYVNADSIAYLNLERLMKAIDVKETGFCDACITGDYPIEIPVNFKSGSEASPHQQVPGEEDNDLSGEPPALPY